MTDVEDSDSDLATISSVSDGNSPPLWDGPPPIFNLHDAIRPTISVGRFFAGIGQRFEANLLTPNDIGDFCIPLSIAAPMLVLRGKLTAELQHDYTSSFLHRLQFPTVPRTNPPEIVADLLELLLQAETMEECQQHLANTSTRVVFEVVVELIQRVQSLCLPISYLTARAMNNVNLIGQEYGSWGELFQQPPPEATVVNAVTHDIIHLDAFKRRIPNILHYLWFQDLQAFNDERVKLVFQFILVNFMHLLKMYCHAGSATTDGVEDGPFMVIDYAQMNAEAMTDPLRVLGLKLGKYLIRAPRAFYAEVNQIMNLSDASEAVTSGKFLVNLLILNQEPVWLPMVRWESFINHDQPNCNFQAEQCICASFRERFPQVVESRTS